MSLLRACEYCAFHQVTYCLDLVYSRCLQGALCAAQQGGLVVDKGEGGRLCIYVLLECKPLVGAA